MLNETDLQEYYEQLKREERINADKKVSGPFLWAVESGCGGGF